MTQAKEDFVLVFPKGMCGEKTIKVHANPFSVRDIVKQILKSQELVFGTICIVQDTLENNLMVVVISNKGIQFFTEDDDVELIKETEDRDEQARVVRIDSVLHQHYPRYFELKGNGECNRLPTIFYTCMRARIVVYDDLCILDETEMLSDKREQIKSVALNVLQTTPDAETVEVYNGKKLIMKYNLTSKGKVVKANTLHPGWGGRRERSGAKSKGAAALTNRVVFHVNEEMFQFLDAMGTSKPEWIRQAIREKREREEKEKGSQ